jgi:hypothetical protein
MRLTENIFVSFRENMQSYDSHSLWKELDDRRYEFCDDLLIEHLEKQGYKVLQPGKDPVKDYLADLYWNAIFFGPTEFMKFLNGEFIKRLDKWM